MVCLASPNFGERSGTDALLYRMTVARFRPARQAKEGLALLLSDKQQIEATLPHGTGINDSGIILNNSARLEFSTWTRRSKF
jgi:hypothetical protein